MRTDLIGTSDFTCPKAVPESKMARVATTTWAEGFIYAHGNAGTGDPDHRSPYRLILVLPFRSLTLATHEAAVAAVDALWTEFEANGAPVKDGSWGYRLLVVDDPDGNQLFFNYPNEASASEVLPRYV